MSIDISMVLSYALTYLDMGLSDFPIAPREKKLTKQLKWEGFQHNPTTSKQIKYWFEGSDSNIAIAICLILRLIGFDIDNGMAKSHADDVIQNRLRQDTRDAVADTLWVATGAEV